MARQFDLHRLRLLRELAHRGTISAVAAAMSYSHSSVSQQLKVLESEVGVSLLEPDGRRVRLTPEADILVQHVESILEQLDQADADLAGAAGEIAGTFRIATFQTVIVALMPNLLTILRDNHPRLNLELVQADPGPALSRLQVGEFDLVFAELFAGQPPARSTAVKQTVLHRDTMRLAVPPAGLPLSDAQRVEDLADAVWVMEPAGSPAREWADRICGAAGFMPKVRFESPDMVVHERLVRGGHAVGFLPDLLWVETLPTVGLHTLPDGGYKDIIGSVRAGTSHHPAVTAAMDALHTASTQAADTIAARLAARL
ncbi:LysR substrate-binding domain-containing protein [Arthrobacter sp. efr-133-TYG-118]|uniref:LysR substrate-binding domain-containing protein n=1 Tax=Arthrobacter sp. efr-133-TYG-118 TaxID=3040279 RepID=UPI00254B600D|nr:LysR substrate-binding domain-containing protein [Arthrobacter sp. efr-133-TYG-118]